MIKFTAKIVPNYVLECCVNLLPSVGILSTNIGQR